MISRLIVRCTYRHCAGCRAFMSPVGSLGRFGHICVARSTPSSDRCACSTSRPAAATCRWICARRARRRAGLFDRGRRVRHQSARDRFRTRCGRDGCGLRARFFVWDALGDELPTGYDLLTCGLFLHHLDERDAVGLLRKMAAAAGRAILVDDLCRSASGLWLARLATRTLSRSSVVHVDGPRSVRAAYSPAEFRELAEAAGLGSAAIARHWPQRQLLAWRRT